MTLSSQISDALGAASECSGSLPCSSGQGLGIVVSSDDLPQLLCNSISCRLHADWQSGAFAQEFLWRASWNASGFCIGVPIASLSDNFLDHITSKPELLESYQTVDAVYPRASGGPTGAESALAAAAAGGSPPPRKCHPEHTPTLALLRKHLGERPNRGLPTPNTQSTPEASATKRTPNHTLACIANTLGSDLNRGLQTPHTGQPTQEASATPSATSTTPLTASAKTPGKVNPTEASATQRHPPPPAWICEFMESDLNRRLPTFGLRATIKLFENYASSFVDAAWSEQSTHCLTPRPPLKKGAVDKGGDQGEDPNALSDDGYGSCSDQDLEYGHASNSGTGADEVAFSGTAELGVGPETSGRGGCAPPQANSYSLVLEGLALDCISAVELLRGYSEFDNVGTLELKQAVGTLELTRTSEYLEFDKRSVLGVTSVLQAYLEFDKRSVACGRGHVACGRCGSAATTSISPPALDRRH
eukprot:gene31138-6277_t